MIAKAGFIKQIHQSSNDYIYNDIANTEFSRKKLGLELSDASDRHVCGGVNRSSVRRDPPCFVRD